MRGVQYRVPDVQAYIATTYGDFLDFGKVRVRVRFVCEQDNPADSNAISVRALDSDVKFGYVPREYTADFRDIFRDYPESRTSVITLEWGADDQGEIEPSVPSVKARLVEFSSVRKKPGQDRIFPQVVYSQMETV